MPNTMANAPHAWAPAGAAPEELSDVRGKAFTFFVREFLFNRHENDPKPSVTAIARSMGEDPKKVRSVLIAQGFADIPWE
jgi:hypothetical protein